MNPTIIGTIGIIVMLLLMALRVPIGVSIGSSPHHFRGSFEKSRS